MRQLLHQPESKIAAVAQPQAVANRKVSSQMESDMPRPIQVKPMFRGLSQELSSAVQGEGEKLPAAVQQKMEAALDADFSDVRVHEGTEARKIGAIAYTQGSHIHFSPGRYDPLSSIGQSLLGHELAHVLQQRKGIVKPNLQMQGQAINNEPALEHEADVLGQKAATMSVSEQSPSISPKSTAARSSTVVQCVGGIKFGIKPNENLEKLRETAGYTALKAIVDQYDKEVRLAKQNAKTAFQGHEKKPSAQDQYSERLFKAEKNIDELRQRIKLDKKLILAADQKTIQDAVTKSTIAELVEGSNAYHLFREVGKDSAELGQVQNIYKKHKLEGVSSTEYVESGGRKLRRYADRGITPDEKQQIRRGGDVKPVYATDVARKQNQTGIHYPENANSRKRAPTKRLESSGVVVRTGDLDFLHDVAGVNKDLKEVPLASRPFLQERKGVNKEFSATATKKSITSNHGSGFGTFGSVTLDLAKVDPADILHHYANTGEARMDSGVPKEFITNPEAMKREEKRAGLTAIRNREVHLNKYPTSAIVGGIQDSQGVIAYKNAYYSAYRAEYVIQYNRGYEDGYTEGWESSRGSGDSYKQPNDRTALYHYTYHYQDNGVGDFAGGRDGTGDGRTHGDQDGFKQGKLDGSADLKVIQEERAKRRKY